MVQEQQEELLVSQEQIQSDRITVEKPELDDRDYEYFVLPNQLKVLLISDPKVEKAAAAMDVRVGYLSDPDDIPGLAHFLEHMLFLGTEKYPVEDYYKEYLAEHGGRSNAYTSMESTNYYFDVSAEYLEKALDIFSQFFICPLFTESATFREMNAVDSEHKKNLQTDSWRLFQLTKHLANKAHPFAKFGTGNLQTLDVLPKEKGINIRNALLEFHHKYYSANVMKLVILGKEPLSTLRQWAENYFSAIVNKNIPYPSWKDKQAYTEAQLRKEVRIVPVKDFRKIVLEWPMPPLTPMYKAKPARYWSHLLGHEGRGSIYAYLKEKGWVTSLSAGESYGCTDFTLFSVEMHLTEEGENHFYEIICIVFEYIELLRQAGVQKWIFDEISDIANVSFRFKEKKDPFNYVSALASNMQEYEPAHIVSGPYIFREYNPELIQSIFEYLRPSNMRIQLISKKFAGHTTSIEPYYQTEYSETDIQPSLLSEWVEPLTISDKLAMVTPNQFIAKNFDVKPPKDEFAVPQAVLDNDRIRMWFLQDKKFHVPKANLYFNVIIPSTYASPVNILMARLFTRLVEDSLNEYAYDALLAGLSYSCSATNEGFQVNVSGFNDKIRVLTEKVFERIKNLEIKQDRFDIIKEKLARSYRNFRKDQPVQHALDKTSHLLYYIKWNYEDYLAVINEITIEQFKRFVPNWMSHVYIESFFHGNLHEEEAIDIMNTVSRIMGGGALLDAQKRAEDRIIQLGAGEEYKFLMDEPNDENENSAIEVYLQLGMHNTRLSVLNDLLHQVASERVFNQLRTQEQIGYLVWSGVRRDQQILAFRVLMQSAVRTPEYMDMRVDIFLENFKEKLISMTQEEFDNHVSALITKKLEKDKELLKETSRFWKEITNRDYQFDRAQREVDELKTLKKDDLVAMYNKHILGSERRKLSVQILSHKTKPPSAVITADDDMDPERKAMAQRLQKEIETQNANYKPNENAIIITNQDIAQWKNSMPLYPSRRWGGHAVASKM